MKQIEIERLFRQHYTGMLRLAKSMLYDDEESRDVVSEVFAMLMRLDIMPKNAESYLMRSVRNRCLNLLEHKDVRARFERAYAIEMKQGDMDEDLSSTSIDRQYQQLLAYARRQLPERTFTVFEMRHLHGMKYQEIADKLGISRVMVYKHLTKAMTVIREYQQKIK